MWALKGTFLAISHFAVGAAVLMLLSLRTIGGPLLAGPGQQMSIDIRAISLATIYNPWFWAAFAASIVIGLAIAASWPGRFSPVFWVVLAVIDLVPAGLLSLVLLLVFKLKEAAAAPK
jgi:hypothetical protein